MEETTALTSPELNTLATEITDNRRVVRPNTKRKVKGVKHRNHAKAVIDPISGAQCAIPSPDELPKDADLRELRNHVRKLTKVVQVQSTMLAVWREQIKHARLQKEIPLNIVTELANSGASQHVIANLLGFSTELFKSRKDLHDAWATGHAELQLVLGQKQIESAMKGNPLLQIFLGKNILGQKDTPTVAIQNNVETSSALRTKIKQARKEARDEWHKALSEPAIEGEVIEHATGY